MHKFFGLVCLSLLAADALAMQVTVVNALGGSPVCNNGNTLQLFANGGQQTIRPGQSATINGDFSNFPGLGIQVNNWYWTQGRLPVQGGNPQNPDNSGAQFKLNGACGLDWSPAWYGKGIETYRIASVTAARSGSGCTITVRPNGYTNAVTPGCCAPPIFGGGACAQNTWGRTQTGQSWPPR